MDPGWIKARDATRLISLAVIEAFGMNREVEVFRRLLEQYGPQGWWPADSAFEVVVGALLMPQTSWRNVAAAIRNLKAAG
ncbi:MAG: hypothetical protein E6K19_09060, partial [Methanobacteriota archaeon]